VRGFCDGWYRQVVDVPFEPRHGVVPIPDAPGLGVALEEAFLARDDVLVAASET
jgi:L-alanine-DL-glutamate epimerase-like enolase superfamily enzyme